MTQSATDTQQRLSYMNLQPSDRELLAALRPILEAHAASFVAAFYRNLLSFGPTRELLRDPAVKDRLLVKQREYLLSLSSPTLDDAFVVQRRRIGEIHEKIGLEPRWYLGAYALYLSLLTPVVWDAYPADPERAMRTVVALQKLLMLDAQLAMEAYIVEHDRQLTYLTHELESESRQLAQDLEARGSELRVTESRARAAEALASIANLVAGLAHEIGTPMGVIQGHAKLLEPEVSGEQARWRLRTIQEQVARISKIIQTLLNMARPGRRRLVPVALEPLVETTLSFVSEKLKRRGIEVSRSIEAVPSLVGDPERLQQLFLNLFLNAADAMPDGGELRVSLRPGEAGEVEVRIADSGCGIDAQNLPHIFEPFFTTKPAGEGNGLGLMVVKGIVTDHGGSIEASSTPGEGTEFCIHFPPGLPGADAAAAD
ncbi:MAG: protoglobin domain-containing protein [Candidatus Limnocylindria bacterium]